jgi:hypothetical protein
LFAWWIIEKRGGNCRPVNGRKGRSPAVAAAEVSRLMNEDDGEI